MTMQLRIACTTVITNDGHKEDGYEIYDKGDSTIAYILDRDDANHIVRCVNSRDALVEAIDRLLDYVTGDQAAELGVYDALKLAKGPK